MRSIFASAALGLGVVMAGTVPASAHWSCQGPAYVCGPAPSYSAERPRARTAMRGYSQKHAYGSRTYAYRSARHRYAEAPSRRRYAYAAPSVPAYAPSYGGGSSGMASYYSSGARTASGAAFNPGGLTAAHRSLPFGTRVRVTNRANGQSVIVTINDRGPFVGGRVIDLSLGAARAINMTGAGVAPVSLEVLGRG